MPIQTTGPIALSDIMRETAMSQATNYSLDNAENGQTNLGYPKINLCSPQKPSDVDGCSLSEWRGYDHYITCTTTRWTAVFNSSSSDICNSNPSQPPVVYPTPNPTPVFGGGTRYDNTVYDTIILSSRSIVSVGLFSTYNSISQKLVSGLTSDGSVDPLFDIGTGFFFGGPFTAEQQKTDTKIVIAGSFTTYKGQSTKKGIIRLNSDGTVDSTFSNAPDFETFSNNAWTSGSVLAVKTLSDGKILLGGTFTRLNGSLTRNRIIRLNSDGSIDSGFNLGTGFNNSIYQHGIQIQSDGKILINGAFTTYNGVSASNIVRLNTDGTRDATFNYGTGFTRASVSPIAYASDFQSTGKIITVGIFEAYNGTAVNNLVRINSNGTIDNTFTIGSGLNAVALCVKVLSDDSILIGGTFTSYNGTASNRIVKLNSNGAIDTSFNVGTGFNAPVNTIVVQSDGKIVVSGEFTTYNGTTCNRIIRLNTNGSIDS